MYTDGSKEDKWTAMSFGSDDHEFSCRINDETSICTAELLAIEAAIEYIWDSSDEELMITIDSHHRSMQALKTQKLNNPIVSNILYMCHYLSLWFQRNTNVSSPSTCESQYCGEPP